MERTELFDQLARHAEVFRSLLHDLSEHERHWSPAPEKWSPVVVICHLVDEEREDFRARLKHVLETPDDPMPKIDPAAWLAERKYSEQDLSTKLNEFLQERERSVQWLRGLVEAPWTNAYMHPKVGPVSCDLLLTNWVAHDLHHIRQLINLRYAYLVAHTDVPMDYAGTW